uniref:BTB_2 domain-containing protein n=1 Tax=Heterorhabditis bacteriophora TaxID=37862 RepID=A0A1I7WDZ9_HETBA
MVRRVNFNSKIPQDKKTDETEPEVACAFDLFIKVNIGGKSHFIRKELYSNERTLMHDIVDANHESRLALVDGFDVNTGEYYIERNSRLADHIMDFYATGSLHKPNNVCPEKFKEELAFWRISTDHHFILKLYLLKNNVIKAYSLTTAISFILYQNRQICRFIIYPKKGEFVKKTLNIIDMLTILPFYLELCLPLIGVESRFKEITGTIYRGRTCTKGSNMDSVAWAISFLNRWVSFVLIGVRSVRKSGEA